MSDEITNESERFSGQRRFVARPKICQFCADKNIAIDYKNTDLPKTVRSAPEGKPEPALAISAPWHQL